MIASSIKAEVVKANARAANDTGSPEVQVAAQGKGKTVQGVRHWALQVQARSNHNKATCALANKLARICYATLRDKVRFGEPTVRLGKKISRESFVMPA